MRALLALLIASITPAAAEAAETNAPSEIGQRMQPLSWMVGEWHGVGWMLGPNGSRRDFTSREIVTSRLNGNALLVEGEHRQGGETRAVVHDAMAMLTWDADRAAYRFRTALADGHGGDYPLELRANGFTWTMTLPQGRIDYQIDYQGDRWIERGFRSVANGKQVQFFEMTLSRK